MKNYIALSLILIVAVTSAQITNTDSPDNFLGKISLSVNISDNPANLDGAQLSKLQSKVLSIATRNGVGGVSYNSNFVMYPKLEIYNTEVAEGMRNITVVTTELNLFIKQQSNGLVFSSYNTTLKGSGFNKADAINNAISQINPSDPKAKAFIEEGKNKIISFYNSKCNDIISEADKYSGMNDYERALAILMSVPVEATPCYDKIKDKSIKVFKLYQSKRCESLLQAAKAQSAGKQYMKAFNILAMIDPNSSCYGEAKALINTTETKLDAYTKTQWDHQREIMKDKMEIEKMQIQAMRDVTVAYFNRTPLLYGSIFGFLF